MLIRLLILLLFFSAISTCQKINIGKKQEPEIIQKVSTKDTVSYYRTLRKGIPPPPDDQWWSLDTENLTPCQNSLWRYLKNIYPVTSRNSKNYPIYALYGEPDELTLNRAYVRQYIYFFNRKFWQVHLQSEEYDCANVLDTVFFEQALGQPTCKVVNEIARKVTYIYALNMKYRKGGCPDISENTEGYCDVRHTQYCGFLRTIFSIDDGKLTYIDFSGT